MDCQAFQRCGRLVLGAFVHNGSTPNNSVSPAPESRAARIIREVFESGRPLTYIRSSEEQRVGKVLREVGQRLSTSTPVPIWTWSLTEGMHRDGRAAETGTAPRAALDFIAAQKGIAIFH